MAKVRNARKGEPTNYCSEKLSKTEAEGQTEPTGGDTTLWSDSPPGDLHVTQNSNKNPAVFSIETDKLILKFM